MCIYMRIWIQIVLNENFVVILNTGFHLRYAYKSWSRTVEYRFIKYSGRNDVIYSGIKDKSVFVNVERSATKKKLINFESLCCNMGMSIFFIVFRRANRSSE